MNGIIMDKKKIYDYLSSAEGGNQKAKSYLCQTFYDNKDVVRTLPDDFWKRVDKIAQKGEDYANFLMHCRYFDDPDKSSLSYEYIRKAIRHKDVALAALRLGVTFSNGIGVIRNQNLANYFFEMAFSMGCKEAETIIEQEYDLGKRDIAHDIENDMEYRESITPQKLKRYHKQLDKELKRHNYGIISRLQNYSDLLFPDYDKEKAYDDIINNRDTKNANICYSWSSSDNISMVNIGMLDSFQQQLFLPFTQDTELYQEILKLEDTILVGDSEQEILQAVVNLRASYGNYCKKIGLQKERISKVEGKKLLPYMNLSLLVQIKKQVFRCILSLRDAHPSINVYLEKLDSDTDLLDVCETVEDVDLQLFLISFVEINIDVHDQIQKIQEQFEHYKNHEFDMLADILNDYAEKMKSINIEHNLPTFTSDNLPEILL